MKFAPTINLTSIVATSCSATSTHIYNIQPSKTQTRSIEGTFAILKLMTRAHKWSLSALLFNCSESTGQQSRRSEAIQMHNDVRIMHALTAIPDLRTDDRYYCNVQCEFGQALYLILQPFGLLTGCC